MCNVPYFLSQKLAFNGSYGVFEGVDFEYCGFESP